MRRLDVAIIGGSLAGAACARELARRGIQAVAFERDRFPRDKVCGGLLSPGAVVALDRIGMLDAVRAAGAVEVKSARVHLMDREISFEFPHPGLGVSRRTLDALLADGAPVEFREVRSVDPSEIGFRIRLDDSDVFARIVVDAAGKLTRFTKLRAAEEFGVHFYESASRGDALDFWFFKDGYGGTVRIEGGRTNACFLVNKESLPRYIHRRDCLVTGPIAYRAPSPEFITIGDAAGMIDPFCGEGIHHALDSASLAANAIAIGLERSWSYPRIRRYYASVRRRRWGAKRALMGALRGLLPHRTALDWPTRAAPLIPWLIRRIWRLQCPS